MRCDKEGWPKKLLEILTGSHSCHRLGHRNRLLLKESLSTTTRLLLLFQPVVQRVEITIIIHTADNKMDCIMSALSLSLSGHYPGHHAVVDAEAKHVSFQEKTHTIETDGTVGCAALKESKVVLLRHTTSLPLSFNDFGHHCDVISADSHEEEEHPSPADEENRLDCRSSYKKFAPRSKVPYVTKRASM